jgi:hypothetical protein
MSNTRLESELSLVTDWLLCASSLIEDEYFRLPVADGASRFRERVYCYELYHRWRCHWVQGFRFSLCGEVDKRGSTRIRGKHLSNTTPDFLVHVPEEMTNLLVMEVKPASAKVGDMVGDLKKLTAYRRDLVDEKDRPANYCAAYFWLYGNGRKWPRIRDRVLTEVANDDEVDLSLIRCFVHEAAQVPAVKVFWS